MYDEQTLKILRMRVFDYEFENDPSRDNELQKIAPNEVLRHLIAWEIGDPSWLDWLIRQVVKVGGSVTIPAGNNDAH